MELKPGYKQSEAGAIPEDWEVSTVGREFEIKLGKMLDAEKNAGVSKPYLGNRAVQWERIDSNDLPTVPMSRADIQRYRLRAGDLLVCEGGEVGRAAVWEAPVDECYYQKALHRLRPLRGFDSRLMVALLRQWSERGLLTNYATQTSIAHLPRERFLGVPMPVPPQAEQRAIATVLLDSNMLLDALDRVIGKKRAIKQGAMQQLLTGKARLPGFDGVWNEKSLKAIVQTPVTDGPHLTPRFLRDGIPFLSVNNLVDNKIDLSDLRYISMEDHKIFSAKCKPQINDVLFGKAASVGKVAIVDFDLDFNIWSPIALIRVGGDDVPRFVYYQLQSADVGRQIGLLTNSSSQGNIGMKDIERLMLQLPSREEQVAIATVLSDMDTEIAALEQRRSKTAAIKQGMMQQVITGQIRLVEPADAA